MRHTGLLMGCSLAFLISVHAVAGADPTQLPKKRPPASSRAKQPPPPPIGFDELITSLRKLDLVNTTVSPAGFVEVVRQRCVGFAATPEQVQQLKDAGAPAELITLVPHAPPPQPPPKPPVAGTLTVNCRPADCVVFVNGRDRGKAANGTLQISDLRPETTWIEARREGYLPRTESIVLQADRPATVSIELRGDPAVAERAGNELFWRLLRAYRGSAGALRSGSILASGVLNFNSSSGEALHRDVLVEIALPEAIRLVTLNGKKRQCVATYKVSANGADFACEAKKSPDEALKAELQKAVLMLAAYYPPVVLDTLLASNVELTGPAPDGHTSPVMLRAVAGNEVWQFALNKDSYLPQWIGHTGSDKVTWTAEFATYHDPLLFPLKLVIHDQANKNRTEFSFTKVEAKR